MLELEMRLSKAMGKSKCCRYREGEMEEVGREEGE